MATIPKPQTEEKLSQLASDMHLAKDDILDEAVDHLLAYNSWLRGKVSESLAAAERGEVVADEDVLAWIEKREQRERS